MTLAGHLLDAMPVWSRQEPGKATAAPRSLRRFRGWAVREVESHGAGTRSAVGGGDYPTRGVQPLGCDYLEGARSRAVDRQRTGRHGSECVAKRVRVSIR